MILDNVIILCLAVFGVILMKTQRRIMPNSYFNYSRLIDGIDEDISIVGLLYRFLIPIIIGAISGLATFKIGLNGDVGTNGAVSAFMVIFLLVWPDFLNPEEISPQFRNVKTKLYGLYLLLFCMFIVQGWFSAKAMVAIYPIFEPLSATVDWPSIINNLLANFIWLIVSAISVFFYIKLLKK